MARRDEHGSRARPAPLGHVLAQGDVDREAGRPDALVAILAQARWRTVAGPSVAAHTAVLSVASGGVTVGVPSVAWQRRLERIRSSLREALGPVCDGRPPRWLAFELTPVEVLRTRTIPEDEGLRRRATTPEPEPAPLSVSEERALAALDDERFSDLRGLFSSWMRHARGTRKADPTRDEPGEKD